MSTERLSISVVMCAYTQERWTDLLRAIASVQRQSLPAEEIILIIDHNKTLFEQAREALPGVTVIENWEERGLSGARNSGIANARGEIIAFIDEDAVASSNWIESLLGGYHSENIVGVGGAVRPLWTVKSPGWFPEEFNWVVGCSYKGLPEDMAQVRNPIGCNMSFRKQALLAAGGFRNGIGRVGKTPVGCEETELSIRLGQINPSAVILYQPEAIVYHKVPEWRASWDYFAKRCYAEGVSKALVTQFVGSNDGLSSERTYTAVTLPRAIFAGLKETIFHKNGNGLRRTGAIIAGLVLTMAGFMAGSVQITKAGNRRGPAYSEVIHKASRQVIP